MYERSTWASATAAWSSPRARATTRWAAAAGRGVVRIATKYPTDRRVGYFTGTGRQAEIVEVKGSVEITPLIGLTDAVVDLTATGTALRENGLVKVEQIADADRTPDPEPGILRLKAGSSALSAARKAR